jgi:hypothetical protein
VLGRSVRDLLPQHAGLDPRDPRVGVDGDTAHPVGAEEDRAVHGAAGGREVPRPLRCDGDAAAARVVDDLDDVLGRMREDDGERPLVHREVPGETRLVPCLVGGGDDVAFDRGAKRADVVEVKQVGGSGSGHGWLLVLGSRLVRTQRRSTERRRE